MRGRLSLLRDVHQVAVADSKGLGRVEAVIVLDAKELGKGVVLLMRNVVNLAEGPLASLFVHGLDHVAQVDRAEGPGHHVAFARLDVDERIR